MKINFSKFLNRSKTATIPAAKFSGQRYGVGNSAFYDEDENEDVRMVRPSKHEELPQDDVDVEFEHEDDTTEELNDHALMVVVNMLNAMCCDDESCEKAKQWLEDCDCLNPSDKDYLLGVLDADTDETWSDMNDEFNHDNEDEWYDEDDADADEKKNF